MGNVAAQKSTNQNGSHISTGKIENHTPVQPEGGTHILENLKKDWLRKNANPAGLFPFLLCWVQLEPPPPRTTSLGGGGEGGQHFFPAGNYKILFIFCWVSRMFVGGGAGSPALWSSCLSGSCVTLLVFGCCLRGRGRFPELAAWCVCGSNVLIPWAICAPEQGVGGRLPAQPPRFPKDTLDSEC